MAINKSNFGANDAADLNNVGGASAKTTTLNEAFEEREIPGNSVRSGVIGLSSGDSYLMGNSKDSEILAKFAETSAKVLSASKFPVKTYKMDLDQFDLGFSHTLYALKADDGVVYYFSALLEATGTRAPLTVDNIVKALEIKNSSDVLVTADAFDADFYDAAEAIITKAFSVTDDNIVFCQGVVVPTGVDVEVTAEVVARYAQDIMVSKYLISTGNEPDVTIADINEYNYGGSLNLDLAHNSGSTINMVGRSIKTDFNLEVSMVKNNQMRSLNGQSGRKRLTTTSGYLDFVISEVENGYTGQIKRMAQPMFVLNEFAGMAPTLNYALLSIINSATFSNHNVLKSMVVEKDAGPLNYLFNYNGDGAKYGDKISFKDEGANPELIADIIRTHIIPSPIIALDIEEFGSDYSYMLPFSALASNRDRMAATDVILEKASELVGTKLDCRSVTDMPCTFIPLGEFMDSDGEIRDIREIDTVFIAKHINEPSILIDWIYSSTTPDVCIGATGKDPYILKLEVLDKISAMLNITITIKGRAVRVVLSGDFVNNLTYAAMSAGYNPRTDSPNISYNDYNNLQAVASAYSTSGINASGFGASSARRGGYTPQSRVRGFRR